VLLHAASDATSTATSAVRRMPTDQDDLAGT
jgi:hypothetical protein